MVLLLGDLPPLPSRRHATAWPAGGPRAARSAAPSGVAGLMTEHPGRPPWRRQRLRSKPALHSGFPSRRTARLAGLTPPRPPAPSGPVNQRPSSRDSRTEIAMPVKRTSQAREAVEEHMRSGHDIDQSAHVANTFALLSIAENLDALVEIGIDAIAGLKQIVRRSGPIAPRPARGAPT